MGADRQHDSPEAPRPADEASPDLAMLLTGDLPCIGCGYDIRGQSVLGQCPECGLAVRATVLHRVDPQAHELLPMPTPWATSFGLLLWSGGGLAAALMCWVPRVADLIEEVSAGRMGFEARWAPPLAVAALAASGLGALGMIRPVVDLPRWRSVAAALAFLMYAPLIVAVHRVASFDLGMTPYIVDDPLAGRIGWKLAAGGSIAAMLVLIRPNARELVDRSLVLRTKRVDRQTILATLGALAVALAGDGLRLLSTASGGSMADYFEWVGSILVLVGSVLVTLGLGGAVIDSRRIARAILAPSPSPQQALRRGPAGSTGKESGGGA